jgi:hypothetical protein
MTNIDIYKEELINITEAHKHLPREPARFKLAQWINDGLLARNGKRVHLEAKKVGGELCTSKEAFARFCDSLTDDSDEEEVRRILEEED